MKRASVYLAALVAMIAVFLAPDAQAGAKASKTTSSAKSSYLKLEDRGPAVHAFEVFLESQGYLRPRTANGHFNGYTKRATKAFQRAHGLEPDGVYGSKTHAARLIASKRKPSFFRPIANTPARGKMGRGFRDENPLQRQLNRLEQAFTSLRLESDIFGPSRTVITRATKYDEEEGTKKWVKVRDKKNPKKKHNVLVYINCDKWTKDYKATSALGVNTLQTPGPGRVGTCAVDTNVVPLGSEITLLHLGQELRYVAVDRYHTGKVYQAHAKLKRINKRYKKNREFDNVSLVVDFYWPKRMGALPTYAVVKIKPYRGNFLALKVSARKQFVANLGQKSHSQSYRIATRSSVGKPRLAIR